MFLYCSLITGSEFQVRFHKIFQRSGILVFLNTDFSEKCFGQDFELELCQLRFFFRFLCGEMNVVFHGENAVFPVVKLFSQT